jgi:LuxR family transcriptional regulator, maltose regulon positive regulatory protein
MGCENRTWMMTAAELAAEADQALVAADWETARRLFSEALAQDETPEALEGLARASFFLNDGSTALEARERAYSSYRSADRAVDAARVAIALAWDYRAFRGERAISDGWLAQARRLLEGREPTSEHGWLALREGSFALPGDVARVRERCAEAERLGRELGDVDLEMTAIALEGLARVSQGDVPEGMARLDEATAAATAGEMRDPVAIGFSCCYLIFACERVRDFERAGEWCQRLARMAEGWNVRALRAVCRAHYGTVLMLRGDWDEAEAVLNEAADVLPAQSGEGADTRARLAELRRRQGRTDEAMELVAEAEHHPIAVLTAAACALSRGDTQGSVDGGSRYLRLIEGARTERAAGLELLAEAHAAAGSGADAAADAGELSEIAETAGTDPLRGAARAAQGHAHAATGRLDEARQAFDDAVQLLGRAGLPFEAARARVALARTLRDLGRADAARHEFEVARARLTALGAHAEERRAAELERSPRSDETGLSPREQEILALVARGLSNKEIAAELTLSEHTVHRHVANILVKLRLSSRTAAAAYAVRHGLAG